VIRSGQDETVGRTMLIAVVVALVCSAMVSGAVFVLRPLQAAYASLERNKAILSAAGYTLEDAPDKTIVETFLSLDARSADLVQANFSDLLDGHVYDHWAPALDLEQLPLPDGAANVGLSHLPRYVPVYLTHVPGQARMVLPLHGQGMWSTLYGYVALKPDLRTVAALVIYKHGETPGIGDRIEDPKWLASWRGKRLFDEAWQPRLQVGGDVQVAADYQVDAITGATVSSQSLIRIVRFWAAVYAPLLKRMGELPDAESDQTVTGDER